MAETLHLATAIEFQLLQVASGHRRFEMMTNGHAAPQQRAAKLAVTSTTHISTNLNQKYK